MSVFKYKGPLMMQLVIRFCPRFKMPSWPIQDTRPKKGWDIPNERMGTNPEVLRNVGPRDNSRSEHIQNRQDDEHTNQNAYDTMKAFCSLGGT